MRFVTPHPQHEPPRVTPPATTPRKDVPPKKGPDSLEVAQRKNIRHHERERRRADRRAGIVTPRLRRFFIELERSESLSVELLLGVGITAWTKEDALGLLYSVVFEGKAPARVIKVTEDVDVKRLDADHIAPHVGDVKARGVWFPPSTS
jgi:hypothetical protein